MKRYMIEIENSGVTEATVIDRTVNITYPDKPQFFMSLENPEDTDDFVFKYEHGRGKGEIIIPSHVMFVLPEMFTVLNHALNRSLSGSVRIYGEPVATLFPNGETSNGR